MTFTKQQTFDIVAKHLLTQGRRATNLDGHICMYRAPNGDKCAAGCLIPDEQYVLSLEGQTVYGHTMYDLLRDLGHDITLVKVLQRVHDCGDHGPVEEIVPSWPRLLRELAGRLGLSSAVVDELAPA